MSEMHRLALTLSVLVISALCAYSVNAKDDSGPNYCVPLFVDVTNIYLIYEEKIPNSNPSTWGKVLKHLKRANDKFLTGENINLNLSGQDKEQIFEADKNALVLKLFYSHVDKAAFTIPLKENQVAVWLEVSRMIDPYEEGHKEISTRATQLKFLDLSDPTSVTELSSATYGLIEGAVCDVMRNTAHKRCTNTKDFSENKIVPVEMPCIKGKPERNDLIDSFNKAMQRGD